MIAVRFATLAAVVVWLTALIAWRFGDLFRRLDLVSYACGTVTLVGLLVMKFVGPPPHGFIPRAAIAFVMLAIAIVSAFTRVSAETASALLAVEIALGFALLTWYVRE